MEEKSHTVPNIPAAHALYELYQTNPTVQALQEAMQYDRRLADASDEPSTLEQRLTLVQSLAQRANESWPWISKRVIASGIGYLPVPRDDGRDNPSVTFRELEDQVGTSLGFRAVPDIILPPDCGRFRLVHALQLTTQITDKEHEIIVRTPVVYTTLESADIQPIDPTGPPDANMLAYFYPEVLEQIDKSIHLNPALTKRLRALGSVRLPHHADIHPEHMAEIIRYTNSLELLTPGALYHLRNINFMSPAGKDPSWPRFNEEPTRAIGEFIAFATHDRHEVSSHNWPIHDPRYQQLGINMKIIAATDKTTGEVILPLTKKLSVEPVIL